MKKILINLLAYAVTSSAFIPVNSLAATVNIDYYSSASTAGDFQAIGPFTGSISQQGLTYELIKSSSNNWNFSVSLGDLWGYLDANQVTQTPGLVFGYAANQKNNSPIVTISSLSFSFERESGALDVFSLGANEIRITDFNPGNSEAEAIFQIDLGFDFMAEYSANTASELIVNATLSNNNNGPDRLFLASSFTTSPIIAYQTEINSTAVPIPPSLSLFASGLGLIMASVFARTKTCSQNS